MSKTLLNFIETNKKKGLLFWLNYLITNLNIYKEIPVDNSWKQIKLKSSYIPKEWDVNNPFGSISREYNKQFNNFKRYAE